MKKVLIITYYWPPSGGSGVQRWLKFTKYLPSFGVEPHIYTPSNPNFNVQDDKLINDIPSETVIIKKKIVEPYGFYRALVGKKNSTGANFGMTNTNKTSKVQKMALWVRSNIFLPDPRVWWVRPSYNFLKTYIEENDIEAIITTGPPHSMHLIGLKLKKKLGNKINWIADFRDPWSLIFNKDVLLIGKRAQRKIKKFEQNVINGCDKLITVSDYLKQEFEELGAQGKAYSITNGYDESDYDDSKKVAKSAKYTISYIGLLPKISNPELFWKALSEITKTNAKFAENLEIVLVGKFDPSVQQSIASNGLDEYVAYKGLVSHGEAIQFQKQSDLLLLAIPNVVNSKGILTGKFFEYMASQIPILAFGPSDGDVAKIMKETGSGDILEFIDYENTIKVIESRFENHLKGFSKIEGEGFKKYSRKQLTEKLVEVITE